MRAISFRTTVEGSCSWRGPKQCGQALTAKSTLDPMMWPRLASLGEPSCWTTTKHRLRTRTSYYHYKDPTYGLLRKHYGLDRLYILSAGWGLLSAKFLTPAYDITFASSADPSKRRLKGDKYDDCSMLSPDTSEPIVFFGGKDYVPLFCKLTAGQYRHRTVFYAGRAPDAPDCDLRLFGDPFTNWHYQCAKAVVQGRILVDK